MKIPWRGNDGIIYLVILYKKINSLLDIFISVNVFFVKKISIVEKFTTKDSLRDKKKY